MAIPYATKVVKQSFFNDLHCACFIFSELLKTSLRGFRFELGDVEGRRVHARSNRDGFQLYGSHPASEPHDFRNDMID
jgi:hypothetical protein